MLIFGSITSSTIVRLTAGFTILLGVSFGYQAVDKSDAAHFDDAHKASSFTYCHGISLPLILTSQRWGVFLVVLYIVQCVAGALIYHIKPATSTAGRLHVAFGLSVIALSFYQVRVGYKDEWVFVTGRVQLAGMEPAWWTLLIVSGS